MQQALLKCLRYEDLLQHGMPVFAHRRMARAMGCSKCCGSLLQVLQKQVEQLEQQLSMAVVMERRLQSELADVHAARSKDQAEAAREVSSCMPIQVQQKNAMVVLKLQPVRSLSASVALTYRMKFSCDACKRR